MQGPPPVPSRLGSLPSLWPVPENHPHEDIANMEIWNVVLSLEVFDCFGIEVDSCNDFSFFNQRTV